MLSATIRMMHKGFRMSRALSHSSRRHFPLPSSSSVPALSIGSSSSSTAGPSLRTSHLRKRCTSNNRDSITRQWSSAVCSSSSWLNPTAWHSADSFVHTNDPLTTFIDKDQDHTPRHTPELDSLTIMMDPSLTRRHGDSAVRSPARLVSSSNVTHRSGGPILMTLQHQPSNQLSYQSFHRRGNYHQLHQQQSACFSTFALPNSNTDDEDAQNRLAVRQSSLRMTQPRRYQSTTSSSSSSSNKPPRRGAKLGTTKVPTPPAPPSDPTTIDKLRQTTPKNVLHKTLDFVISIFQTMVKFVMKLPYNLYFYATHPDELRSSWNHIKEVAKEEINHYWVGFKLLWADVQTARTLVLRTLQGTPLTRRERNQLLRTVSDLFRMIPFSMFLIIPFMEFALPFALRLFPGMLPSTFQDSLKAEETMKRELQSRIAMAKFFQETMEELAKEQKRKAEKRKKELEEAGVTLDEAGNTLDKQEDSAASMLEFLEKARKGEMLPPDVIIRYANYFQDDLTLDNMPRMQLVNMCKYMSIPPYGSDAFLRFQLRHRIRVLKDDDQRILWEGIDSLTKMELREACQERGMRSTGLSKDAYKRSLQQWLDLSVNKNVPISLLIMSRTFFLRDEMSEPKEDDTSSSLAGLADAISGLDKEVVDQVILEVATSEEKLSDPDIRKLKLEVVSQQNELIRQEQAEREASNKRKEAEKVETATTTSTAPTEPSSSTDTASSAASQPSSSTALEDKDDTTSEKKSDSKPTADSSEDDRDLSTEEMDAISQLVSEDPVSKEREELARIKAAMREKAKEDVSMDVPSMMDHAETAEAAASPHVIRITEPLTSEQADAVARRVVESAVQQAAKQADASTKVTIEASDISSGHSSSSDDDSEHDDPVVARLKKRVESMVDKIEVQLSQAEVKIGDKLHFLDKDRDGVLSREEMAQVLQQVLKRKITVEEAMEIADEMDENRDGFFTVQEMIKWIDENKLVKFVEEGRDADMDRIMEKSSSSEAAAKEGGGVGDEATGEERKTSSG